MSSTEPKTDYHFFPSLPFNIRFAIMIGLVLSGLFFQLYFAMGSLGLGMILAGSVLGSRRKLSNKVNLDLSKEPEWQTVTEKEWDRTIELKKQGEEWGLGTSDPVGGPGTGILVLMAFIIQIVFIYVFKNDKELLGVFFADSLVLLIPTLFTGRLVPWSPPGLNEKIKIWKTILTHIKTKYGEELQLQPMLGLAKTKDKKEGVSVPVDSKMMVKIAGATDKFLGVQLQCSINDVEGTRYPYLYAVLLFAPDFPIDPKKAPHPKGSDLDFEPSATGEAITMVVRQHTTKTSGYHTNERRQIEIVDSAIELARRILAENG